jgi:Zn-dependent protease with chaperone function
MELDSKLYLHDSDRAALLALKAIPGFTQVLKAFMKVWNEQQYKILNMSSRLKLGPNQMAKYYNMLPPICEKLGIDVPELYVELNVEPNSYTYGDTHPFIVITSGLFETLPDELIPTVLAHECGHIACHHVLYTTMGSLLISGMSTFLGGLGNIAWYPIMYAFMYWMRCSEFSADRAAAIYDGNADKMAEVCMRLAGYNKQIAADASMELFMEQAKEYKDMVDGSKWNKTLEFITFRYASHPMTSVRAYEIKEWEKTERFKNIEDYLNGRAEEAINNLPVELSPQKMLGKNIADVQAKVLDKGLYNVTIERVTETNHKVKEGGVVAVSIDGKEDCEDDWYKRSAEIILRYYAPKTMEELALEHPGEILIQDASKRFVGMNYKEAEDEITKLGFYNIQLKEMALPKFGVKLKDKENTVAKIIIGGQSKFDKNTWFKFDAEVILYCYVAID